MKNTILQVISIIAFTLAFAGCDKDNAPSKTITVASVKPVITESTIQSNFLPQCIYKDNGEWKLWPYFNRINGFDEIYEEGYEYEIFITQDEYKDEGCDPSEVWQQRFKLEKIISKVKKDSEGVPTWMTELPAERTITVASVKPHESYTGYSYIFKEGTNGNHDWDLWKKSGRIESFDDLYEEGYEYVIRMKILYVDDDPHDYLGRRYELLDILSKTKMQSSGIPDWMIHY